MMAESKNRFSFHLLVLLIFSYVSSLSCVAQHPDSVNRKRLNALIITSTVGYTAAYAGFYQLWYKNSPRQRFQFFNDNAEWKQVDKLGHFYSSFYFTWATAQSLRWANVEPTRADFVGALTGFLLVAPIEIFDGYSADYGASAGDLIADASGSLFFLAQKKIWKEIRIIPKFSYQSTSFAPLRPNTLGDNSISRIFKDYNGQTHWLSFDMDKFVRFPKWLNIATGYGATGMIYGRDFQNKEAGFDPMREYYISIDFDLTAIPTRSRFLKTLLFVANTIKIPSPTVGFSRKGASFQLFGF
jgi:hypothetical protein